MSIAERVRGDELFAARATEMKRVLIASIIGTALEWYDFLIYATASALVFTKLFFPSSNPGLSAIASFGTLGVGYLARPLGAAIFGHFGDRFGRKAMLATTIVIMGLGTFLMGLLPLTSRSGSQRRSSWSCCGCFSVWDSWANGAALCGSWSRTRRARIAGFSVRWFNSDIRSAPFLQSASSRSFLVCRKRTFSDGHGAFRS